MRNSRPPQLGKSFWISLSLLAFALGNGSLLAQSTSREPTKKQEKLIDQESGFLGDLYPRLAPDPTNGDWLTYLRDPDVLRQSDTFLVEPVRLYFVPGVQKKDVDEADQTKLSDYFTKAIHDQLEAGHYHVVSQSGPRVKILRFAITNVQPNGGGKNAVAAGSEAVAAHAVVPVPGASELVPRLTVGKVSIEGEVVDAGTQQVDMAFMTSKSGRRFFSGLKAFQKWGDIDAAFRGWAKNFRERLDKAHAS